jgi:hypothetical protein
MRRSMRDLVYGLVLLAIGGFLFWETTRPKYADVMGLGMATDPALYPRVLLKIWLLVVGTLVVRGFIMAGERGEPLRWWRLLGIVLATAAYGWLMSAIGFVASSVAFCLAAPPMLGYRRPPTLLAVGIGLPVLIWAVFTYALQISLPTSPWFHRI